LEAKVGSKSIDNPVDSEALETKRVAEQVKDFEEKLNDANMHLYRQLNLEKFVKKNRLVNKNSIKSSGQIRT
jgi:hypothetical protein